MTVRTFGKAIKGPVAYVLAGGASYGSMQVGMLRALAGTDLRPDFIVGTSVGSLNGGVLAYDPDSAVDRLTEAWTKVSREDIFGSVLKSAVAAASLKGALVSSDGLRKFLESTTPARDFADLKIPHTAMTTDFDTGLPVPIREGDLVSALLASSAIPGVFPVVNRDGQRLVDGGLVANVPIGEAVAQGAETVVVLDCGFTVLAQQMVDDSLISRINRTAAIVLSNQVRRDLEKAEGTTILYLPGPWPAGVRPDNFSKSAELIMKAEMMAKEWLAQVKIEGPGRYGSAPSDSLVATSESITPAAADLAKEAGIPVDESKPVAEVAPGVDEGQTGSKVVKAGQQIVNAAKSVTGSSDSGKSKDDEDLATKDEPKKSAKSQVVDADDTPVDSGDEKSGNAVVSAGKQLVNKAKSVATGSNGEPGAAEAENEQVDSKSTTEQRDS